MALQYLDKGNEGERVIELYLIHDRKREVVRPEEYMDNVLPAIPDQRGPRLQHDDKLYVMPDRLALASKKKTKQLVEAKAKDVFAWYIKGQCWHTGIDAHFFHHYGKVQEITGVPVWILFLHRYARPPNAPSALERPTGLFGGSWEHLDKNINQSVGPEHSKR